MASEVRSPSLLPIEIIRYLLGDFIFIGTMSIAASSLECTITIESLYSPAHIADLQRTLVGEINFGEEKSHINGSMSTTNACGNLLSWVV